MGKRLLAKDGSVVFRDEPDPDPGPGEVSVRTSYSAISPGTERSIIAASRLGNGAGHEYPHPDYTWPVIRSQSVRVARRLPRMPPEDACSLGYSLAGVVEQVGTDVLDLRPGDRVACSGTQCAYHADRVVVPRSLAVPVPDGISLMDAAHVTLGAIALESFRRTGCGLGESCLMVGTGMLGLLITQMAACAGTYAIAIDRNTDRLELARRFGAMLCFSVADTGVLERIRDVTGGFGVDGAVIAIADPSDEPMNVGFDALRAGGRVVALGAFGMKLDRARYFRAQAALVPSVGYGLGRYDPVYEENNIDLPIHLARWTGNRNAALFLRLLAERRVDLDSIPTIAVPFDDASTAFEEILHSPSTLTAVLRYPGAPD